MRKIPDYDNLISVEQKEAGLVFTAAAIAPQILGLLFMIAAVLIAGYNAKSLNLTQSEAYDALLGKNWYIYCSYLVSQIGFMAVGFFFLRRSKKSQKELLPLNKPTLLVIIAAILLALAIPFCLGEMNGLFIGLLKKAGYTQDSIPFPALNGAGDYILCIVIIALLPALFEELLFRGIILSGMRRSGDLSAILLSGLLFSIFHMNPLQTPYQFVYGVIMAFIVVQTSSLIPAVIMHFINNAVIITFEFLSVTTGFALGGGLYIALIIIGASLTLLCLGYFYFINRGKKEREKEPFKRFFIYAAGGIAVCILAWFVNFFTYLT